MKILNKQIILISILSLSFSFTACQNARPDVEEEFTEEMNQKGNSEISIDDIQKDLNKKDAELENMMQEMEDEMNSDTISSEN